MLGPRNTSSSTVTPSQTRTAFLTVTRSPRRAPPSMKAWSQMLQPAPTSAPSSTWAKAQTRVPAPTVSLSHSPCGCTNTPSPGCPAPLGRSATLTTGSREANRVHASPVPGTACSWPPPRWLNARGSSGGGPADAVGASRLAGSRQRLDQRLDDPVLLDVGQMRMQRQSEDLAGRRLGHREITGPVTEEPERLGEVNGIGIVDAGA